MLKTWLYILCLMIHLSACTLTAAKKTDISSLVTREITSMMKHHHIPGVAVALYAHGKPYLFHFGEADTAKHTLVTDQTIFEIGSATKVFTALLLALEVVNGKMKLSDPISLYIPSLQRNPPVASMTLLQLACHTSKLSFDAPDTVTSQDQLLAFLQKWKSTSGKNTSWGYSNYGIELLRIALENNNNLSFDQLLNERILAPLRMEPIGCAINSKYASRYASCYGKNGKKTIQWDHSYMIGTAALRATSKDMLNFLQAALGLACISATLQEAMRLSQTPFFHVNNRFSQGLAWEISSIKQKDKGKAGPRVHFKNNYREVHFECPATKITTQKQGCEDDLAYEKTGSTHGFHAYVATLPSKKSGIVIMVNRRMESGWDILRNAGRAILAQL